MHYAEERHGTSLGVFAVVLLFGLALLMSVHAPSRDEDEQLHSAAAVAW